MADRAAGPAEGTTDAPMSYAAAEAELEAILAALEDEAVDVDQLSGHVERAKALISWCRQRVAQAELSITELLADEES
jgi:exodeoxyribonuclease VII small subunit